MSGDCEGGVLWWDAFEFGLMDSEMVRWCKVARKITSVWLFKYSFESYLLVEIDWYVYVFGTRTCIVVCILRYDME